MTEAGWLACDDPAAMLAWLTNAGAGGSSIADLGVKLISDRKLLLFAEAASAGCDECRRLAPERPAERALYVAHATCGMGSYRAAQIVTARRFKAAVLRDIIGNPWRPVQTETHCAQCRCARCTHQSGHCRCAGCGNAGWTGLSVWLAWNGGTVPRLAQRIYDERAFDLLPMLSDALEEAGCDNEDMVRHCRGEKRKVCHRCDGDGQAHGSDRPFEWSADTDYGKCVVCKGTGLSTGWALIRGPHARGCWVIDLLLGKGVTPCPTRPLWLATSPR